MSLEFWVRHYRDGIKTSNGKRTLLQTTLVFSNNNQKMKKKTFNKCFEMKHCDTSLRQKKKISTGTEN